MVAHASSPEWALIRTTRPAEVVAVSPGEWVLRLPSAPDLTLPRELVSVIDWALRARGAIATGELQKAWLRAGESSDPAPPVEPCWEHVQDVLIALELFECRNASGQIAELVDRKRRYVEERDMSGWERSVQELFERYIFQLEVPSHGAIVELGTARGVNFQRLCEHFGEARCIGYDVVNYARHARVVEADVRELDPTSAGPVALGFNDLSDWSQSPASKRAGFDYLVGNIVPGGYYVDATLTDELRRTLPLGDFEHVLEAGLFSVYRRR